MKRTLLLFCAILILGSTSAQKSEWVKPSRVAEASKRKKTNKAVFTQTKIQADSLQNALQREAQLKISNQRSFQATLLQDELEMKEGIFLDEIVSEGHEKRTYTYSKEGRRETETFYLWQSGNWVWNSQARFEYEYNADGLYTRRSIYSSNVKDGSDEIEISRVEISYKDGNRYYKWYNWNWSGDNEVFLLTQETGYDSQGREILYKIYTPDGANSKLSFWTESRYDASGLQILQLYWYDEEINQSGFKEELIITPNTELENRYSWNQSINDWELESFVRTTTDGKGNIVNYSEEYRYDDYTYTSDKTYSYNEAGRLLQEIALNSVDGEPVQGWKDIFTYDSYNRITSNLYQEYVDGEYVNESKAEFSYWGTEKTEGDLEDFEGPLLTYTYQIWENNKWEIEEELKLTRNSEGIIIGGTGMEKKEIEIDDEDVFVTVTTTGHFDEKGNLVEDRTRYETEDGTLVREKKSIYAYDTANRLLHYTNWLIENDALVLNEEENYAYDSEGRQTLDEYRYIEDEDNEWYGLKKVVTYTENLTQFTFYPIDPNTGEFKITPQRMFVEGTLADGTQQIYDLNYDENGTALSGLKNERKTEGSKETVANYNWDPDTQSWRGIYKNITDSSPVIVPTLVDPMDYFDGIDVASELVPDNTLEEHYEYENGDWILQSSRGYHKEPNGDLVLTSSYNGNEETILFSFDSKDRIIKIVNNETDIKLYTYNEEGLLATKNENGTLSIYSYSVHQYLPVDIDEVEIAQETFRIEGKTIISNQTETVLRVYAPDGRMCATGKGSVSVPEKGIYILEMNTIRQKIAIP